jgi:SAM-dependent methyltransferase/uncharacterized protein YbaR (Trm112 family)
MNTRLVEMLVCPACLPVEKPLRLEAEQEEGTEIVRGTLTCPACGAKYEIADGVADLVAPGTDVPTEQGKYDTERLAASYLWSHYADLWDDREATDAYARWLDMAGSWEGPALDAGCAVGRFTLELAARNGFAVGVDLSRPFVALARQIVRKKEKVFTAPRQGHLTTRFGFSLPKRLQQGTAEFVRADAMRLPFRAATFGLVASLNVVDKLPAPKRHLEEAMRLCAAPGTLLVADPFSWSETVAKPEDWLGGTPETGDSAACIAHMLGAAPDWKANIAGSAQWTLRDHANRYEHIRSEVILARHVMK